MDAMFMMLESKFRYLPVVDETEFQAGMFSGMMRIQKCLYEAIKGMEKVQQWFPSESSGEAAIDHRYWSRLRLTETANVVAAMMEQLLSSTMDAIQEDETRPRLS
ncbi:hypothetical protein DVH05_010908 [Phytophthora capsici]|nr:hypothetical protein DVH05_010908 [Phytophthora capsici]